MKPKFKIGDFIQNTRAIEPAEQIRGHIEAVIHHGGYYRYRVTSRDMRWFLHENHIELVSQGASK